MTNVRTLPQIAKAIKALEKKTIHNVVEIGKLLHEASEHDKYLEWLKSEFGWSQRTAYNYRDVYELSQNCKICNFDKLDISISALYLAAKLILHNDDLPSHITIGMAIIEAARHGRVSYQMANDIWEKRPKPYLDEDEPDPPAASEDADVSEDESPADDSDETTPDEKKPSDGDTAEQQWQRSLGNIAGDQIALQAFWTREFGDWEKFEVPSDLSTLAKQAAYAWTELAAKITKTSEVKAAADRAEMSARDKAA
jgi:hypothetical protein